ncbi:MAG: hypothetical protein FWC39_02445 [Bacteroidetes bacterium]|nr:hypothetical protein [Bacteroidota bacterium]
MKRNLFTIAAGLLIGFGATAQATLPDGTQLVERGSWAVVDGSEVQTVPFIFTPDDVSITGISGGAAWQGEIYAGTEWNTAGTELTMKLTGNNFNNDNPNWSSIVLEFLKWDEQNDDNGVATLTDKFYSYLDKADAGTKKYNAAPMIVSGKTVDFSDPRKAYIMFEYKLTASLPVVDIQFDLIDVLDRRANANEPLSDNDSHVSRVTGAISPATEWTSFIAAWDPEPIDYDVTTPLPADLNGGKLVLFDRYSPEWHGKASFPIQGPNDRELAVNRLCGVAVALMPDASKAELAGVTATLVVKNFRMGETPVVDGFKTVKGDELQVVNGVVFSAGQIVVTSITGQVVAVANGQFDTKTLKGGVYVIKAAEGTAKIVK